MKWVLKKIFPIKFLKNSFLIYNFIKRNTFDLLFFRSAEIPEPYYKLKETKNPFLELNIDLGSLQQESGNKFNLWTDPEWTQDQYIVDYKAEGLIEPVVGWALTTDKRLIYPSLGFANAPHVRKPSFTETFCFNSGSVTRLNKVISLRDTGEENYFHFFNDILAKLFFLESQGYSLHEYTIVISYQLYSRPYWRYYFSTDYLNELSWHVQKSGEWIHFKEAVFCKPYTHTKAFLDRSILLCKINERNKGCDRIFLTRSSKSLRYIENIEELIPVLKKYNFKLVDTANLSFQEQVDMFATCRYLIGIHGAGMTNMIFRQGKPLSVLEIMHPFPYVPFHYIMLSKLYGYHYDLLLGRKGRYHFKGGFRVDIAQLEKKVATLLNT